MAAADLAEAAEDASSNLYPLWTANTLKDLFTQFYKALQPFVSEQRPADVPFLSWISLMAAFAPSILDFTPGGGVNRSDINSIVTFEQAISYVYRFCKFAQDYQPNTTSDQYDGFLAAYNAAFT
jgi:hypothetical protein